MFEETVQSLKMKCLVVQSESGAGSHHDLTSD